MELSFNCPGNERWTDDRLDKWWFMYMFLPHPTSWKCNSQFPSENCFSVSSPHAVALLEIPCTLSCCNGDSHFICSISLSSNLFFNCIVVFISRFSLVSICVFGNLLWFCYPCVYCKAQRNIFTICQKQFSGFMTFNIHASHDWRKHKCYSHIKSIKLGKSTNISSFRLWNVNNLYQ